MIIFDTKGDFVNKFYNKEKDYIIANSSLYEKDASIWNIYKEIVADGWDDEKIISNVNEISWTIFNETIENSKNQPFFANAARDLFAAILTYIIRLGKNDMEFKKDFFNKKALRHTFATRALECGMNVKTLSELMGHETPTITLKRYSHSMLGHKIEMMNKLGKLIK